LQLSTIPVHYGDRAWKEGLLNLNDGSAAAPLIAWIYSRFNLCCNYRSLNLSVFHFLASRYYRLAMSNQPESPTNARHPITPSPTSLVSLFDQNPGDDTAYIVPSPSTSEGNQMGYYRKYGHSPLGENSRAAVKARLLEFEVWSAQNPEFQQRTVRCW
jgi:hypothetical protein